MISMFVDKRGAKTAPARTIPAASKQALDVPNHLEVRAGTIVKPGSESDAVLGRHAVTR